MAHRGLCFVAVAAGLSRAACRAARHHLHRYRHGADGLARHLRGRVASHLDLRRLARPLPSRSDSPSSGPRSFPSPGKRASQIPQEAIIGIAYVVAAAAAVLLLSRAAEGDEEIKNMLVGNILLVTPLDVWKCFGLFLARRARAFRPRAAPSCSSPSIATSPTNSGLRVRWWDFLFYALFGLVVTSFVRIAGVLLVFSYLIVPAVCGISLAHVVRQTPSHRLGHRADRRCGRALFFLPMGFAFRRGDCLHLWRAPDRAQRGRRAPARRELRVAPASR